MCVNLVRLLLYREIMFLWCEVDFENVMKDALPVWEGEYLFRCFDLRSELLEVHVVIASVLSVCCERLCESSFEEITFVYGYFLSSLPFDIHRFHHSRFPVTPGSLFIYGLVSISKPQLHHPHHYLTFNGDIKHK
jgi:hypothetical protein